jgi:hypothetical protein
VAVLPTPSFFIGPTLGNVISKAKRQWNGESSVKSPTLNTYSQLGRVLGTLCNTLTILKASLFAISIFQGKQSSEKLSKSPKVEQLVSGQGHMFFLCSSHVIGYSGERAGPATQMRWICKGISPVLLCPDLVNFISALALQHELVSLTPFLLRYLLRSSLIQTLWPGDLGFQLRLYLSLCVPPLESYLLFLTSVSLFVRWR